MTSIANATRMYGTGGLHRFGDWYANYHGYVSIVVCVFGVITSIFNIIVLTRKNMLSTTNYILTALAVSDMLTMASYMPFALQFYVLHGLHVSPDRNCYSWVKFFYFHVNFTVTTHTVSIWLCVLLSIFRYVYIKMSNKGSCFIGTKQTIIAIVLVYVLSIIILIPNYMSLEVVFATDTETNRTMYDVAAIPNDDTYGYVLTSMNFWIHALVIKLVPCALLTIFGILLIFTLRGSYRRHKKLQNASTASHKRKGVNRQQRSREQDHTRTTCMLIVVIVLFLVTELPQGILALFSGLMPGFFEAYYIPLGDLMDVIALINNAINFILYCTMSKQYRDTFLGLFCAALLTSDKRRITNGSTHNEYSLHSTTRNLLLPPTQKGLSSPSHSGIQHNCEEV